MYLIDTNIVSLFDPRRRAEAAPVIEWLRRNDSLIYVSVMTLSEIEAGILKLLREQKQARALQLTAMRDALVADFGARRLPMNVDVAIAVPRLAEFARPSVLELADLIVAATAKVHGLTVLTRNLRHFTPTGIEALDPMAGLPPDPSA